MTAVIITAMICTTVVLIALIGGSRSDKDE
jgi:hypothetical protein